jgi:hypothetical protein
MGTKDIMTLDAFLNSLKTKTASTTNFSMSFNLF